MSDQPLPSAVDAERAVLGSVLLDRDCLGAVLPWLAAEMFYLERHAWIYEAQAACYDGRTPPDLVNVCGMLQQRDRLEGVGGVDYLVMCINSVPTAAHIEYYGRQVEETAMRRRIIQAGGKIASAAYQSSGDSALETAHALLSGIEGRKVGGGLTPVGETVRHLYEMFEAARQRGGTVTGLPTGYRDLDELLGGLQGSDLIILAARPAVGKSSLALSIAYNVAYTQRLPVGFFALEMSRAQLVQRLLAIHTGLDTQKLRAGDIRESDIQMLMDSMGTLSDLPLYIDDMPGITMRELRSRALRHQGQHGLSLLVVDYLQLIRGGQRSENRVQEVSEISRSLKDLAREMDVPVLALSQLSRGVEGRASRVPMLSDLRESGALEQDADLVMFIYREELYEIDTDKKGVAELHIAKHRNGPVGIIPLRFFSNTTRFADLERYHQPEGY